LGGGQMVGVQPLEVGADDARAGRPRVLQPPGEQRRLSDLPDPLDEHDAVSTRNGCSELLVRRTLEVERRIQGDGATNRFKVRRFKVQSWGTRQPGTLNFER